MDLLSQIGAGLAVALRPENLGVCFLGVLVGTLIGVLPGIGPVGAMSLLFPITFKASPEAAVILLAGIYYGAMYGGSTTSILVNIPGEAASVVTCLDGHPLARQGRAGPALGIAALGSFIGGMASLAGLVLLAPPLAQFALQFGPVDYFSLMVLGLSVLVYLAQGSMARALLMAALGVVLGLVGLDSISARPRLTFDRLELVDGLGLVPIVMGLFGVGEVLFNLERSLQRDLAPVRVRGLWPSARDWAESRGPIARGSLLGFLLGLLPGGGAVIASFLAYAVEKRLSRHPERFGRGALAGVAAPESANNAATGGAFVPLMTLGVPPNVVMALLLGALMVHGVQPGPLLMSQNPGLFWGVVASMAIGNLMLLALNLPLIGLWVQVLRVPYPVLFPLILLLCLVGAYSVGHTVFDIHVMIVFGVLGYLARKLDYEPAPLVLAFVLGPMLENNLRKALILSQGSFTPFVTRPISAVCLGLALLVLASPLLAGLRRRPPPAEAGP